MKGRRFAENTKVPISQSVGEMQAILARYGGDRFQHMTGPSKAFVRFEYGGYQISFSVPLDPDTGESQRLYRSLFHSIKFKLEMIESGIETPAQAFMAQLVTGKDETMFEKIEKLKLLPVPYAST